MMQMFTVKFSNQKIGDHMSGEITLSARNMKHAIRKAASVVSIPGGAYYLATEYKLPNVA